MLMSAFLRDVTNSDGQIAAERLVACLRITKKELAVVTGLSLDAVSKQSRLANRKTQARLRHTVDIINRVAPWAGSVALAFAWFRSEPLPSFGDKTARELVRDGRAEDVMKYLERIAEGGFA